jgi:hypothetical protein
MRWRCAQIPLYCGKVFISVKILSRTGIPSSFFQPQNPFSIYVGQRHYDVLVEGDKYQVLYHSFDENIDNFVHYCRFFTNFDLLCLILQMFYFNIFQNIFYPPKLCWKLAFFSCLGFVWCKQRLCWGIWCPWPRAIRQLPGKYSKKAVLWNGVIFINLMTIRIRLSFWCRSPVAVPDPTPSFTDLENQKLFWHLFAALPIYIVLPFRQRHMCHNYQYFEQYIKNSWKKVYLRFTWNGYGSGSVKRMPIRSDPHPQHCKRWAFGHQFFAVRSNV